MPKAAPRPWTARESKLAMSSRLSLVEVAAILDRSYAAVCAHRTWLRNKGALNDRRRQQRQADPNARNNERRRYYARGRRYQANTQQPWSRAEERQITARNRPSDQELSARLGRSVAAIQSRRYDLKVKRRGSR